MNYIVIYAWEGTSHKLTDYLTKIGSHFYLESIHNCVLRFVQYFDTVCKKTSRLTVGQTFIVLSDAVEVMVDTDTSLSYAIVRVLDQRYMIIFFGLPKLLIETQINYHQWMWSKQNWILLPNLKNDPQYYFKLKFKQFRRIVPDQIKSLRFDTPDRYLHSDLMFKLFVDTHYPITIYDQQGQVILGQNLIDDHYLETSNPLDLTMQYYVSCNELISHKTQPIVRVSIGVYDKDIFLFSDHMIFRIAPIILPPNCLGSETVYLSKMQGVQNNLSFVRDVSKIMKQENKKIVIIKNQGISMYHRWVQDILKFAYVTDGQLTNYIIMKGPHFSHQSTSRNGIAYIYDYFKDYPLYDLFIEKDKNLDAFGNIQVIPPILPDYPLGRIIYGVSTEGMQDNISYNLVDLLESQQVQKPLSIETGWLNVGHVDEIVAFVPDRSHKHGFRVLIASTDQFYHLISQCDPETVIFEHPDHYYIFNTTPSDIKQRFSRKYDDQQTTRQCVYKTQLRVKTLLSWTEMIEDNRAYQRKLDGIKNKLMVELNLTEDDIYQVPIYYWPKSISLRAKSILPNLINNLYVDQFMLVPKPFGPKVGNRDLFEQYFASLIPSSVRIYFVENWDCYYLLEGDINCGMNVKRRPFTQPWWGHMPSNSYNI